MIEKIANAVCMAFYHGEYVRYIKTSDIHKAQAEKLAQIINKNADTEYGRRYGFGKITDYADFAANVPITEYADYLPYIDRIADGEADVLTDEPVKLFELTSGSGGSKKRIPYTESLKKEFCCGIKPWLYDIYKNVRGVKRGKSYWSITPIVSGREYTKAGIPIGFEEDTEYFGRIEGFFAQKMFAVKSDVKFSGSMDEFFFRTAVQLLNCKNLSLISVWNPTFLSVLTDFMHNNAERLVNAVSRKDKENLKMQLEKYRFEKVFPRLKIISCWCDGNAANYRKDIETRFRGVFIQPKGLLSTECFVSFPLVNENGSRLSIYSHFFEFLCHGDDRIYLADELKQGEKYEVIVTTGGGFYRYRTNDEIEVISVENGVPLVRFGGRTDRMSDLFGEKIDEHFAQEVINKLNTVGFSMLAPERDRYVLYTRAGGITDGAELDNALRGNFHYDYCRRLGQLKEPRIFILSANPEEEYLKRYTEKGMRLGDIKMHSLSLDSMWDKYFNGEYI